LVTFTFVAIACEKSPINSEQGKNSFPAKVDFFTIVKGELYGDIRNGITKQNLVIKTQTEWNNLISALRLENSNVTDNFTKENIDFTQYQIIVVFGEIHNNGGWNIDITDITEYTDSIVVSYANIETGNLIENIAQPFQIVKIPASDKNILIPDNGIVVYKTCCEEERAWVDYDTFLKKREAYLFKDSIPDQMKYLEIGIPSDQMYYWIVFDSKTDRACLNLKYLGVHWYCEICNFPNFAKEWNIPQNGCEIYFEGRLYQPCIDYGGIDVGYFDYVLTRLERK
jgi:hypothetical protein